MAVDGRGDHLAAHGDAHSHPVGVAHGESGPWVQVDFRINTEGARHGMNHCHLGQGPGNDQSDESPKDISKNDAGAGETHRHSRAQEEPGANRAAQRDHAHLARAEPARQECLHGQQQCVLPSGSRNGIGMRCPQSPAIVTAHRVRVNGNRGITAGRQRPSGRAVTSESRGSTGAAARRALPFLAFLARMCRMK